MSEEEKRDSSTNIDSGPGNRPEKSAMELFSVWLWQPDVSDGGGLGFLRAFLRVLVIVGQEFVRDNIPLRASALTFTVILSMVPILALGTAVLKGLGAGGQARQAAHSFLYQLEITAGELDQQNTPLDGFYYPEEALPGETVEASLSGHLHRVVDTVFDYVDKTDFAAMGLVGIVVLMFTVFSVLDSIEKTFNDIWQARSGRSMRNKVVDYLALLVVLPVTINFGVATMAALQSPEILASIGYWVPWLQPEIMKMMPILAIVVTFCILYKILPNTKVTMAAALTGGVVGGIGWLLVQVIYFKLQVVVARYNAIYGSFAALPLFLLWIYFGWMVFLVGAEVSFGFQIWRRYLWKKLTMSPIGRLGLAFDILEISAGDYRKKQLTTRDSLVWALKQPDAYIKEVLDVLLRAGLMRQVQEESESFVPAAPVNELDLQEVGDLVLGELPGSIGADNPAVAAYKSLRGSLAGQRLRPR